MRDVYSFIMGNRTHMSFPEARYDRIKINPGIVNKVCNRLTPTNESPGNENHNSMTESEWRARYA